MRWVDFVHDEFSRVDSEISAFMTGFDRAVTVDLGAAGGCGEHAGMAAAGRLDGCLDQGNSQYRSRGTPATPEWYGTASESP